MSHLIWISHCLQNELLKFFYVLSVIHVFLCCFQSDNATMTAQINTIQHELENHKHKSEEKDKKLKAAFEQVGEIRQTIKFAFRD